MGGRGAKTRVETSHLYAAAPITEAVAEIRFTASANLKTLQRLSRKLQEFYPNEVQQKFRGVAVDFAAESASFSDEEDIIRRSTADESSVAVLRTNRISISRLAPYTKWDDFRHRIERDAALALKIWPKTQIERVGLRYINRIDIPKGESGTTPHEDFLTLHIQVPDVIETIGPYSLVFDAVHKGFLLHIQSGVLDPPIPNTIAVLLDIDVIKLEPMAADVPSLTALLDDMRREKNLLFESFISDRARELFDHAQNR